MPGPRSADGGGALVGLPELSESPPPPTPSDAQVLGELDGLLARVERLVDERAAAVG